MNKRKSNSSQFLSALHSAFAAAFGVQTKKNHERDFQQHSIWPYIAAGVIFTTLFLMGLITLAKWMLSAAA